MNKQFIFNVLMAISFFGVYASEKGSELQLLSYQTSDEKINVITDTFFNNEYHKENDFFEIFLLNDNRNQMQKSTLKYLEDNFDLNDFEKKEKSRLNIQILDCTFERYQEEILSRLPWYSKFQIIRKSPFDCAFMGSFTSGVILYPFMLIELVISNLLNEEGYYESDNCLLGGGYVGRCIDWEFFGPILFSSSIGVATATLALKHRKAYKELSEENELFEVMIKILKKYNRI